MSSRREVSGGEYGRWWIIHTPNLFQCWSCIFIILISLHLLARCWPGSSIDPKVHLSLERHAGAHSDLLNPAEKNHIYTIFHSSSAKTITQDAIRVWSHDEKPRSRHEPRFSFSELSYDNTFLVVVFRISLQPPRMAKTTDTTPYIIVLCALCSVLSLVYVMGRFRQIWTRLHTV